MMHLARKRYPILVVYSLLFICFSLCFSTNSDALMINATNIKEIAIYGSSSGFGKSLYPATLVFNVTNSSTISSMISSIEFSTERDCSTLGAASNAYVYIKYSDNTIELYELFGMYSHISKVGVRGSCYYISASGQTSFESNTQ